MDILAESALRITVLALGVSQVLRLLRHRSPRLAHGAWTAVVMVMLALPAVVRWGPTFAMPVIGSAQAVGHLFAPAADGVGPVESTAARSTVAAGNRAPWPISWAGVVVTSYLAGVALLLARLASGAWRLRTIRRAAVAERGHLTHPLCVTPMTVGILAPVVILPTDWTNWDDADLSAVLAHEGEHARRRDPLIVALALLNRAVFWFHPLAWWLPRELSRLSEQACDDAVISRGHDRDLYASCLLRFARRASEAGRRVLPMAAAMSGAGLQARLRMLAHQAATVSRTRRLSVAGACAALVVVCAAAVPAEAQRPVAVPDQARGTVVTSAHFEVFHDGLPAERVIRAVRDAEAAYRRLSAALRYETAGRVLIILVSRDRDLPADPQAAATLALASGAPNRHRIVLSLESLEQQSDLVVHELTHQFAFEIMPATSRTAPALIEGLAEYLRGAWRADDLRLTRAAAVAGTVPSVAALDDDSPHWAHAVFDYVAAEQGAEGIRRLVFALRSHDTLRQAIPEAFGVGVDQFDRGFLDFVAARFTPR
ncbi:MAG TPA: M56 family metallopeptidase [Vicinamibacterales bacterium]|nr:M56 family metallopeptidase [Vicinamibacterales bacterium]